MNSNMTIEEYGDRLQHKVIEKLDSLGSVYKKVTFKKIGNSNGVDEYSIEIIPDNGTDNDPSQRYKTGLAFRCRKPYQNFCNFDFDDDDHVDAYFEDSAKQIAEHYNQHIIDSLKYQKNIDSLLIGSEDVDYVKANVYVDLVDHTIVSSYNPNHLMYSYDNIMNLNYRFVLADHTCNVTLAMMDDMPVVSKLHIKELLDQALYNLNKNVLNWMQMISVTELIVRMSVPTGTPQFIINKLIEDMNAQPDTLHNGYCVRLDGPQTLRSSAILISRTAMLKIATSLKAKSKLQIIPSSTQELIIRNADHESFDIEETNKLIQHVNGTQLPENEIFTSKLLTYDVITGIIS